MLGRSKARAVGTTVLLLLLTTTAVVSSIMIKHASEDLVQNQLRLQEISATLYAIDGREWRTSSGLEASSGLAPDISLSFQEIDKILDEASASGLPGSDVSELDGAISLYQGALSVELPLIATGQTKQVITSHTRYGDPAFIEVERVLGRQIASLKKQAQHRAQLADLGVLLSISLPLLLAGRLVVVRSRHSAEHRFAARYQALVDRSSDLVIVVDPETRMTLFHSPSTDRFRDLLGFEDNRSILRLAHPEDQVRLEDLIRMDTADEPVVVRFGHHDTWREIEVIAQDLSAHPDVRGIVLTGRDITERRRLERELVYRTNHDALTGLPNRAVLNERLTALLAQESDRRATLILADLNRLKDINDALGHDTGDALLVHVGERLREALRDVDLVCRLGGDEFAVLLTAPNLLAATTIATRVGQAISEPFVVDGAELQIDASMGMAVQGEHGRDAATLLRRAETAMYVAKERCISLFIYDPLADQNHPDRLKLLAELRHAISARELTLFYQPQVTVRGNELVGAEALVRWRHPERGLVPPDMFIPLAEQTGVIAPLTELVLEMAVVQARLWLEQGHELCISVNLSPRNLVDDDLDHKVSRLLSDYQVPARLLLLEVTESAIMAQPEHAIAVLERLHSLGVRLSIDDFGAGYTSLALLKTMPVDELKVDRSFVFSMSSDRSNDLIVRSVIDLSHNLGLHTVAEGVEDAETLQRLRDYGCDIAQGYFVSRPLPPDEFNTWRKQHAELPRCPDDATPVDNAVSAPDAAPARSAPAAVTALPLPRRPNGPRKPRTHSRF